jgi:mutator protein MutT
MAMTAHPILVLAAIIRRDGDLLLCKRPSQKRHGTLWEFPGGKLLPGEDLEGAAKRELREELGVDVVSVGRIVFEQQDPGSPYLIRFVEVTISGAPRPLEHEELAWVPPTNLLRYALAPSDRAFATVFLTQGEGSAG